MRLLRKAFLKACHNKNCGRVSDLAEVGAWCRRQKERHDLPWPRNNDILSWLSKHNLCGLRVYVHRGNKALTLEPSQ